MHRTSTQFSVTKTQSRGCGWANTRQSQDKTYMPTSVETIPKPRHEWQTYCYSACQSRCAITRGSHSKAFSIFYFHNPTFMQARQIQFAYVSLVSLFNSHTDRLYRLTTDRLPTHSICRAREATSTMVRPNKETTMFNASRPQARSRPKPSSVVNRMLANQQTR